MKMTRGVSEIDRLIEQGLSLYGEGELDQALRLWERVLVMDPDNAQANSYVDYVRMNYELLTGDGNTEHSGPFGIGDDDPEYQIEILPGEDVEPAAPAPLYMDARDEGWVIGEDGKRAAPGVIASLAVAAEETALAGDPATFESAKTGESISFEDNTREYPGGAGRPATALLGETRPAAGAAEFVSEGTPPFGSVEDFQTPQSFGTEITDIRRRDLGFVQPIEPGARAAQEPPELKMTLRTPPASQVVALPPLEPAARRDSNRHRAPTAEGESDDETTAARKPNDAPIVDPGSSSGSADPASAYDSIDLELPPRSDPRPTVDLVGRDATRPSVAPPADDAADDPEDLLATLPVPSRTPSATRSLSSKIRSPITDSQAPSGASRAPSPQLEPDPGLGGSGARTEEMPYTIQLDPLLAVHPDPQRPLALTRDFSDKPTTPRSPLPLPIPADDPMISAPTRQLGLRTEQRPSTEDEPTGEVDVHKIRATARGNGRAELPGMDPIDARSAEILEEVDSKAPAGESREDRTRRRITALLERATEWGQGADLERSVAAVDLALSEDPNSALAQKLIHRNRDTIMNAFQGFLGDLQRAPALARPLHELGSAPISPRAAFLLSRVDGTLSLDEILDVSGMPRLEAYRYLCQLLLRGILR
jgi:hypothetical protein